MSGEYKVLKAACISDPDGNSVQFFEVFDVVDVGGEKRLHRNADLAFDTEAEAQAWIDKQAK